MVDSKHAPQKQQQALVEEILAGWHKAQSQLAQLCNQVEEHTALAQAKITANFLERDLDKALRSFGEAVWKEVQRGGLVLSSSLNSAAQPVRMARKRLDEQNAEIADLLDEGQQAIAKRDQARGAPLRSSSKSAVAQKSKKR